MERITSLVQRPAVSAMAVPSPGTAAVLVRRLLEFHREWLEAKLGVPLSEAVTHVILPSALLPQQKQNPDTQVLDSG